MTSRAEAQAMRIACIYALGDMSYVVTPDHLRSALAVWRYCEDSARFIFGASLGDPVADELDSVLRSAGAEGLTRTDIRDYFGRNRASHDIARALTMLEEHGRVRRTEERSGRGRPVERWFHVASLINYDINDINPLKPSVGNQPERHTTKVEKGGTMSTPSESFVVLAGGLSVSLPAIELLWELENRRFALSVNTLGQLEVFPASRLMPEDRQRIQRHRDGLLALVRYEPPRCA